MSQGTGERPVVAGIDIRPARLEDCEAIAEIVGQHEARRPGAADPVETWQRRWRATHLTHPWLVACDGGTTVAHAYSTPWRWREEFAWTVEVGLHVARSWLGRGVGTALYASLLHELDDQGFVTAVATVPLPNVAAVALHTGLEFESAGVLRSVVHAGPAWGDVAIFRRGFRADAPSLVPPRLARLDLSPSSGPRRAWSEIG